MADLVKITPAELHLEIVQGDDFRLSIDFDLDLTGYLIEAAVVPKTGDGAAFVIENKVEAAGTFDLVLAAASTAALAVAHHSWYLLLTAPAGHKRTYINGRYIVRKR